jgi:hypothetical protein
MKGSCLLGIVSIWDDKIILEKDGGNDYKTL